MSLPGGSNKRELISKNNSRMLIMIGVAGAVFGFSLVASYTLIRQMNYRQKVISASAKAEKQLKENVAAVDTLVKAYETFDSAAESVIGTSDKNGKIVLDALPSRYDFPALATSLDKIMTLSGLSDITIGGSDNEAQAEQSSANPQPTEIPIILSGAGSYQSVQQLVANLERSIRPIKVTSITLKGSDTTMTVSIDGLTYYQPKKVLQFVEEEVQ